MGLHMIESTFHQNYTDWIHIRIKDEYGDTEV